MHLQVPGFIFETALMGFAIVACMIFSLRASDKTANKYNALKKSLDDAWDLQQEILEIVNGDSLSMDDKATLWVIRKTLIALQDYARATGPYGVADRNRLEALLPMYKDHVTSIRHKQRRLRLVKDDQEAV